MMELAKREKIALVIGGASLFLFVLVQFIVFPFMDKRQKLTKGNITKEKAVVQMHEMAERYNEMSEKNNSLAEMLAMRVVGFSLFSFLEKNAAEAEVKGHIAYMKPSEVLGNELLEQSLVEMKLQAVSLKQLVAFLELVESPANLVGLKRIAIQENTKEKATLDVILQVISVDQVLDE